jgi:hypothetical protein
VWVNGRLFVDRAYLQKRLVLNATGFLRKGNNQVTIRAHKKSARGGQVKVMLSEGRVTPAGVVLKGNKLFTYTRSGREVKHFRHIIPIRIR